MDISNIQGMNAYATNAQTAYTASVQNDKMEATATAPGKESTPTRQEAFQVEITPQALTLQAQKQQDSTEKELTQQPTLQNLKDEQMYQLQNRQGSRLDIIA